MKLIDRTTRREGRHTCNEIFCKNCFKHVRGDHKCFIKEYIPKALQKFKLLCFDIEAMQNEVQGVKKHVPNLLVSALVCEQCEEQAAAEPTYWCRKCGMHSLEHFWGEPQRMCVDQFIDYLETFDGAVTAIAHNMKSYDGHFILEALSRRSYPCDMTMNGWKIMQLKFRNIRIIDSLNFLQMPLSDFAKVFDLPRELEKPFFPFLWNVPEHAEYCDKMPEKQYFMPEQMPPAKLAKFNEWYDGLPSTYRFNMREELLKYCQSDVILLRMGILRFIKFFKQNLRVNPVLEAVTLTSALMLGFRSRFLVKNTLGIVPISNYSGGNKAQSKIGKMWLEYMNRKHNRAIMFEYKLPGVGVYADGFIPDTTNRTKGTVFEHYGCYWHSHAECYKNSYKTAGEKALWQRRREEWQKRLDRVVGAGYKVISQWECEFRKLLKANPHLERDLKSSKAVMHSSLNPRDALFGGLVEAYKVYHQCDDNEQILSLDFNAIPWFTPSRVAGEKQESDNNGIMRNLH